MIGPARYRCGQHRFRLEAPPEIASHVDSVFADLRDEPTDSPTAQWLVESDGDYYTLKIDGLVQFRSRSPIEFGHRAVPCLTRKALDDRPDALHLHAMAVLCSDAAIVVAGPSGAGKSTLCATLVNNGFPYMTDEAVAIDPASLGGHGYRKPLVVKRPAFDAVRTLTGLEPPRETGGVWDIRASDLGPLASDEPHPVTMLVTYRHDAGAPARVEPAHRATMVHVLLSDALDAARFGPESLVVAARLAAGATCVEASGSDTRTIVSKLREQRHRPVENGTVSVVGPASAGRAQRRSSAITSVVVDGRAVLYDPAAQRVIELDESASLWWQLLDGSPLGAIVSDVAAEMSTDGAQIEAVATRFVDDLRSLRLLEPD